MEYIHYNYMDALIGDIKKAVESGTYDNVIAGCADADGCIDENALADALEDAMSEDDAITGMRRRSYTGDPEKAAQYLARNLMLAQDACASYGDLEPYGEDCLGTFLEYIARRGQFSSWRYVDDNGRLDICKTIREAGIAEELDVNVRGYLLREAIEAAVPGIVDRHAETA